MPDNSDEDSETETESNEWDDPMPTAQRVLIEMINGHMQLQTTAVTKLGNELPDRVAGMGTAIATELRIGLRNQSIAFFVAFLVLVVALVALAGHELQVRADRDGIQVGTAELSESTE